MSLLLVGVASRPLIPLEETVSVSAIRTAHRRQTFDDLKLFSASFARADVFRIVLKPGTARNLFYLFVCEFESFVLGQGNELFGCLANWRKPLLIGRQVVAFLACSFQRFSLSVTVSYLRSRTRFSARRCVEEMLS